jgi:hypothetical protein
MHPTYLTLLKLIVLNFYPFLLRYLQPFQRGLLLMSPCVEI